MDFQIPEELIVLGLEYSSPGALLDTPLAELKVIQTAMKTGPLHSIYEPSVCFVLQGRKQASVGNRIYICEPGRFFASSAILPVVGEVIEATEAKPYLCLILSLDPGIIYEITNQMNLKRPDDGDGVGVFMDDVRDIMTDAFLRLMRTLSRAEDRRILAPLIVREITYYLLQSRFARVLYDLGVQGSGVSRISRSIEKIRRDFARPLKMDALARMVDMSPSSFYENFKKITALSPLQFQKEVRLQEARKLLATQSEDITSVAYSVGYESPSQFSREYSRLFGLSPSRDIQKLRSNG